MTLAMDASSWKPVLRLAREPAWGNRSVLLRDLAGCTRVRPGPLKRLNSALSDGQGHKQRVLGYCCKVRLKLARLPELLTAIHQACSNSPVLSAREWWKDIYLG